jgi:hypothetical protein
LSAGFFQKSDRLTEVLAETTKEAYLSTDIFISTRFSHLSPDEKFIHVYCFANARSWLYNGIAQWEKMVDVLKKWQDLHSKANANLTTEQVARDEREKNLLSGNYNPEQVEEIINRWEGCKTDEKGKLVCTRLHQHSVGYDMMLPPYDEKNVTWVLNHGWRYNRSLMHWAKFFDPAHTMAVNASFGVGGRTFNELNSDLRSLGKRDFDIATGKKADDDEGWTKRHFQNPIKH